MKNNLRKRISSINKILIGLLVMAGTVLTVSAEAMSYNSETSVLTVDSLTESTAERFASIRVLPVDYDITEISFGDIEKNVMMFDSVEIKNGKIQNSYKLNGALNEGAYTAYLSYGEKTETINFIICNSQKLSDAVAKANSGIDIADTDNFGFDAEIYNENKALINQFIKTNKPSLGYDEESLISAYMQAEGLSRCINDDILPDEMLEKYGYWLGVEVNSDTLPENFSDEYLEILDKSGLNDRKTVDIVNDAYELAIIKCAESKEQFAQLLLSYIEENNLSTGRYNALNPYLQGVVTDSVYDKLKSIYLVKDLYDNFILQVNATSGTPNNPDHVIAGGGGSSGKGSGGGGSVVGVPSKNTVVTEEKPELSDIGNHWAKNYINELYNKGIISGFPDNSFKPDNFITRAELAVIINKLITLEETEENMFDDVDASSWYSSYVNKAAASGIVLGNNGNFFPENNITRQDTAVIIHRVLTKKGITLNGKTEFLDSSDIADYAAESIKVLAANGIVSGYDSMFRPLNSITRAEAATLISKILNY